MRDSTSLSTSSSGERLTILEDMVQHYENLASTEIDSLGPPEKMHLEAARKQIAKLQKLLAASDRNENASISSEDLEFSNSFIDLFTLSAFSTEFAELNQSENGQFTSEDMATLAESIRTFALGIEENDRSLFRNVSS